MHSIYCERDKNSGSINDRREHNIEGWNRCWMRRHLSVLEAGNMQQAARMMDINKYVCLYSECNPQAGDPKQSQSHVPSVRGSPRCNESHEQIPERCRRGCTAAESRFGIGFRSQSQQSPRPEDFQSRPFSKTIKPKRNVDDCERCGGCAPRALHAKRQFRYKMSKCGWLNPSKRVLLLCQIRCYYLL